VVVRKREVTGCLVEFVIWPVKRLGYTFTFRVVICGYVRTANNKALKARASGKGSCNLLEVGKPRSFGIWRQKTEGREWYYIPGNGG
jgi:hypothetical protein